MFAAYGYRFGPFLLETKGRVLSHGGQPVPLSPKVAETLLLLVENAGEVVDKEELLNKLWPDTFVEEGSLARNISVLRRVLEDLSRDTEYITTISKRGYRFSAPVTRLTTGAPSAAAEPAKIMLAVLPFENLSADRDQEYFSDGLTEEMITQLGRINPEQLGVIARTSAMRYKGTEKTVAQIGKELGVSFVLEGSVRRSHNRLRITAQLIEVRSQTHLWAESFDRTVIDVLEIQSEIAQSVAKQIEIKLSPKTPQVPAGSLNAEAYELCLKGRYFWYKRTEEALRRGLAYFQQAIGCDPACAAGYDGICDSYVLLACRGMEPVERTFAEAKAAAQKALEIDPTLVDIHASIAHIRLHEWDWEGLDEEFKRVVRLNPSRAIVYPWYSEYLVVSGRPELGIAFAKEAERLDPLSTVINTAVVTALYFARKYEAAVEQLRKGLEIDPKHFLPHLRLGQVSIPMKKFDVAITSMQEAVSLSGRSTETLSGLAQAYAAAGMRAETEELLRELDQQANQRYVSPYLMSKIFACLGDKRGAFARLDRAYDERNPDLIELKVEPVFDDLRSDVAYQDLLERLAKRARVARNF